MKNREIKFRSWDKLNKEMIYFSLFERPTATWGKHCEIMQYTGLKDKNKKEIYEGDIVKAERSYWDEPRNLIVEWFGERYGLRNPKDSVDSEVMDKESCFNVSENEREIIGNIYENPELLTKK